MQSHKEVLTICSIDGKSRTVHIKIMANKLVVCPEWKKCPNHGKPECQAIQMHQEVLEKIRKGKTRRKKRKKTRG